jgi:hypothetical protein
MVRRRTIIEAAAGAGALLGLVLALDAPGRAPACRGGGVAECAAAAVLAVARPYLEHALAGACAGLVAAAVLVAAWPGSGSGSGLVRSRGRPLVAVAPPRREPIPERVRHEVWRRDRGACVDCGSRARLEFDHIVPVARGGSNTARHVELRCEPCNRRKGARV